jgi:hypothetical protein
MSKEKITSDIDSVVTDYQLTGECKISVENTIKLWDKHWCVSQWHEEYTLCHHNRNMDNFTRTDLKVRISKQQAHELIGRLNLIDERSPVFTNGRTWRQPETASHE